MAQRAIYPGTFDPITHGHQNLIERASQLFDEVVVAVADSAMKRPWLDLETRVDLVKTVLVACPKVRVVSFNNLLVDFAKAQNIKVIVRGLRAATDFDYEYQLIGMNRHLEPTLETVFLPTAERYAAISASLVREIANLGGDVTPFVAPEVVARLPLLKGRLE